ncbi:MAG: tRNA guanosine(34) transglycosylase Tgt [Candidatus Falkowbacteria bacterium]
MFKIIKKSNKSQARLGVLKTAHGSIKTPFFMPCATQGAVKHVSTKEVGKIGAEILLANTYHLMLKPGEKIIKQAGGLHDFMNWQKPILTDSGGFQIFSLSGNKSKSGKSLVKLEKDGVKFKSYIDGKEYYLTPEKALKIQIDLGVDIAVCLDVCPALPAKKEDLKKAVELTSYWAKKTKNFYNKTKGKKPLVFCVIQGGLDKKLRLKSLKDLVKIGWDGYNIGGLSVGESSIDMYKVLDYLVPEMPENKPRYLMGVGYPENIVEAVKRGVDMFDCVIPTREGRHGRLFTSPLTPLLNRRGELREDRDEPPSYLGGVGGGIDWKNFYNTININRAKFEKDFSPINPDSKLPELRGYSKAYLHYLFKINEPLGRRLASLHNLEFYFKLMNNIRIGIGDGCL